MINEVINQVTKQNIRVNFVITATDFTNIIKYMLF